MDVVSVDMQPCMDALVHDGDNELVGAIHRSDELFVVSIGAVINVATSDILFHIIKLNYCARRKSFVCAKLNHKVHIWKGKVLDTISFKTGRVFKNYTRFQFGEQYKIGVSVSNLHKDSRYLRIILSMLKLLP